MKAELIAGNIYRNGKSYYEYLGNDWVINTTSGWKCQVHNVTFEPDGSITWGHSTGGYFAEYVRE